MHDNHQDIVKRLRMIEGQVTGIRKMQEDGRYCIEVLDQISAARAGLEATARLFLQDRVNGCVREAIQEGKGEEKSADAAGSARPVRQERLT
jgi:DNA-binding FrmR family transcriptional regulator